MKTTFDGGGGQSPVPVHAGPLWSVHDDTGLALAMRHSPHLLLGAEQTAEYRKLDSRLTATESSVALMSGGERYYLITTQSGGAMDAHVSAYRLSDVAAAARAWVAACMLYSLQVERGIGAVVKYEVCEVFADPILTECIEEARAELRVTDPEP